MRTTKQLETLEHLIDATSLADVLVAMTQVCGLKAEHLQSNWQDNVAAKSWDRDAERVETLAGKVHN